MAGTCVHRCNAEMGKYLSRLDKLMLISGIDYSGPYVSLLTKNREYTKFVVSAYILAVKIKQRPTKGE
ncbi:hypothetical protein R50072_24510 [Simiduia litorea]